MSRPDRNWAARTVSDLSHAFDQRPRSTPKPTTALSPPLADGAHRSRNAVTSLLPPSVAFGDLSQSIAATEFSKTSAARLIPRAKRRSFDDSSLPSTPSRLRRASVRSGMPRAWASSARDNCAVVRTSRWLQQECPRESLRPRPALIVGVVPNTPIPRALLSESAGFASSGRPRSFECQCRLVVGVGATVGLVAVLRSDLGLIHHQCIR